MKKWVLWLSFVSLLVLAACSTDGSGTGSGTEGSAASGGTVQQNPEGLSDPANPGSGDATAIEGNNTGNLSGMDAPVGLGTYGYYEGQLGEESIQFTWDNTCLNKPVNACDDFVGMWQFASSPDKRYELRQTGEGQLVERPAGPESGDVTGSWSIRFEMEYIRGTWKSADGKTEKAVNLQLAANPRMQKSFELTGTWLINGRSEQVQNRLFISNPTAEGFDYEISAYMNGHLGYVRGTATFIEPGKAVHRYCVNPSACRLDEASTDSLDYELTFIIPEPDVIQLAASGHIDQYGGQRVHFPGTYEKTRLLTDLYVQ